MLWFVFFVACFHWGPRAVHKRPAQTALDKTYQYDGEIIIVGAGPSGLSAARVLEQNNIRYTVLEATDQYGGRLQEKVDFADFPVDLGAEWIHNRKDILDLLSGQEGTAAELDLIPYHLENAYIWENNEYRQISQQLLDLRFQFFPEYKFKDTTWNNFIRAHFAEHVLHNIKLNSPVSQIDYSGEKVTITLENGEVLTADKVLLTVSIGVLRSGDIEFYPPLPEEKRAAISSVDFLPGFKLLLKFS